MLKILRGKYDEKCVTEQHGYSPELSEIIGACLTMDPSFRPGVSDLLGTDLYKSVMRAHKM